MFNYKQERFNLFTSDQHILVLLGIPCTLPFKWGNEEPIGSIGFYEKCEILSKMWKGPSFHFGYWRIKKSGFRS